MKIIEAMKAIKDLQRKLDDIKAKIQNHCADLDCETPVYGPDQRQIVRGWLQSCNDITKEILRLRYAIQKTNISTQVSIEIGGKFVSKSIAEWIHRRKDLAAFDQAVWKALTDRNLRESQTYQVTPTSPVTTVKRRLYFDPLERDQMIELYRSEPAKIDSTLEVVNAVTDLIQ